MSKDKDDNSKKKKKEASKTALITPFVMLLATAVVAIYTFFQRFPLGRWLVIVLFTLVIFFAIGASIQKIVERYVNAILEKEKAEAEAEAARAEEVKTEAAGKESDEKKVSDDGKKVSDKTDNKVKNVQNAKEVKNVTKHQ